MLQLAEMPQGVRELVARVGEQHPHPERSWTWAHVAAYQAVLPLVTEAGRARAAAKREARKQVVRHG